jgi:hypothetical protein
MYLILLFFRKKKRSVKNAKNEEKDPKRVEAWENPER